MNTNANDVTLATNIFTSMKDDMENGTLASIVIRKKGSNRGRADNKTIYGDDLVHVLIWTGFRYSSLVERSFKKLHQLWGKGNLFHTLLQAVQDAGYPEATISDVAFAVSETDDAFIKVIRSDALGNAGIQDIENPVWEPLKVDGTIIPGAKVYVGGSVGDSRTGTIYIDGVKIGEKILEPAKNGQWLPKQKPKTVAKDILRSWLPVGLYTRYALEMDKVQAIKVGAEASAHAKAAGVPVDPDAIRSLFKIAP